MGVRAALLLGVLYLTGATLATLYGTRTVRYEGQPRPNIASSADGGLRATANREDGTITLRMATSTRVLDVAAGVPIALSPDGKTLASSNGDTTNLWDVTSGKKSATLNNGRGNSAFWLAFSPDGGTLATGTWAGAVFLSDVTSGERRSVEAPAWADTSADYATNLAFAPDGATLAATMDERTAFWDVASGKHIATLDRGYFLPTLFTFSSTGRLLVPVDGPRIDACVAVIWEVPLVVWCSWGPGMLFLAFGVIRCSVACLPRMAAAESGGDRRAEQDSHLALPIALVLGLILLIGVLAFG